MKNRIALLASAVLCFVLSACGNGAATGSGSNIIIDSALPGGAAYKYSLEQAMEIVDASPSLQELSGSTEALSGGVFRHTYDNGDFGDGSGRTYTFHKFENDDNLTIALAIDDKTEKLFSVQIDFDNSDFPTDNKSEEYMGAIFADVAKSIEGTKLNDNIYRNITTQENADYNEAVENSSEYSPSNYVDGNSIYQINTYDTDTHTKEYLMMAGDSSRYKDSVRKISDYEALSQDVVDAGTSFQVSDSMKEYCQQTKDVVNQILEGSIDSKTASEQIDTIYDNADSYLKANENNYTGDGNAAFKILMISNDCLTQDADQLVDDYNDLMELCGWDDRLTKNE